ncbi:hypothetical protein SAMN05443247_08682 [Bradyrhizobium erythrophlei]|nr:hypothetical protein SAMN05443247_08682 [Bradyrhizobium erythrophlei]
MPPEGSADLVTGTRLFDAQRASSLVLDVSQPPSPSRRSEYLNARACSGTGSVRPAARIRGGDHGAVDQFAPTWTSSWTDCDEVRALLLRLEGLALQRSDDL